MSLTISELESERAKILEEIESKAQTFSSGQPKNGQSHSLKDWLNAAEEVMPQSEPVRKKPAMNNKETRSNYTAQMMKPSKNKASFFGVIIMLSLLLTLLGVLYIAYTSIHKELQNVLASNQLNSDKMTQLQVDMDLLQKATSTGGKADLFISLEDKVFALEAQVLALHSKLENPLSKLNSTPMASEAGGVVKTSDTTVGLDSAVNANKIVTEAVLDQKLKAYTQQLEQKIDIKLQTILNYLSNDKKALPSVSAVSGDADSSLSENNQEALMSIVEPTITQTTVPVIKQPLVQLVKSIATPQVPEDSKAPIENYTADVKWLMNEPALHYTLQLASMPEQSSVEEIVRKNGLKDVKIIPQTRNGTTNFVLIAGSFADRKQADQLAKQYKSDFAISAWIRKIKDITARVK